MALLDALNTSTTWMTQAFGGTHMVGLFIFAFFAYAFITTRMDRVGITFVSILLVGVLFSAGYTSAAIVVAVAGIIAVMAGYAFIKIGGW